MRKYADCAVVRTTRDLINYINDNNISKEDIVTVLEIKGQIFLIYYK